MIWRLPTLRTYLLLPILSIILEIPISPYQDFGMLLVENIALLFQALLVQTQRISSTV